MEPVASYFRFNPTGAFSVDWYIGKRCNFACSYCVDYLHDYTSPHAPIENMKKFVDIIYEKEKDNVLWSLTGGEPTIHPNFLELCQYIKNKGSRYISVTTNGSRTLEYFKELFLYVDGITQSFHFEFINDRVDEYIDKFIELDKERVYLNKHSKPKKTLILRFMVETGHIPNIEKMEAAYRKEGITNIEHRYIRRPAADKGKNMQPIDKFGFKDSNDPNQITDSNKVEKIEENEKVYYNSEEIQQIENIYKNTDDDNNKKLKLWFYKDNKYFDKNVHYNELNYKKENNFEGWLCWAGIKHCKIASTGDVYIGNCHLGGKRGNMYDIDNIDLPTEPIRCSKWRCTDNTDLKVPKIKDWKHYSLIKDIVEYV